MNQDNDFVLEPNLEMVADDRYHKNELRWNHSFADYSTNEKKTKQKASTPAVSEGTAKPPNKKSTFAHIKWCMWKYLQLLRP